MAQTKRDALRALEAAAARQAEAAGIFSSPTSKGRAREIIANDLLGPHLPQRAALRPGEIIDSSDGSSGEVDLIVVDGNRGVLSVGGALVPCEAAIAGIEVKSHLGGH